VLRKKKRSQQASVVGLELDAGHIAAAEVSVDGSLTLTRGAVRMWPLIGARAAISGARPARSRLAPVATTRKSKSSVSTVTCGRKVTERA